jgi:putative phosphoesterase
MLIGLISDVHANHSALRAVLASARAMDVSRFIFAGDLVGYYYDASQCLAELKNVQVDCVSGNHDRMLVELSKDPLLAGSLADRFGSSHSVALATMTAEQVAWVGRLPTSLDLVLDDRRVAVAHGSPWSDSDYVYQDSHVLIDEIFGSIEFDLMVLGNTHRQMQVVRDGRTLVNPGSVGQPRGDSRGAAQWALVDTHDMSLRFMTEHYDTAPLSDEARLRDPSVPYLWEVLSERQA